MNKADFNQDLLDYLAASPTPFHAVQQMAHRLEAAGFSALSEQDSWSLKPGRYYVTRNGSSIVAFVLGSEDLLDSGVRMVGAHTDSPCLKVKPNAGIRFKNYQKIGVEVYGGVLLNPWFDRDLSLAGRVTCSRPDGTMFNCLIDFERPIATIPSLCIHLDREANDGRSINKQQHIAPVMLQSKEEMDFNALILKQAQDQSGEELEKLLDFELCFYDTQRPALNGLSSEFIASARLDNLLSCYIGLQSLIAAGDDLTCLLVCNDHEEVGSASAVGANGPFLKSVLERLQPANEDLHRTIARSLLISCDNAHGIHPNYADRHDSNHGPILNDGPVIKINANQRYATNSVTSGYFRAICERAEVPCQSFVNRTDLACGSTIGPITATEIGVATLDVGVPTFAMHSIRELGGAEDPWYLHQALNTFYADTQLPSA